jgi:hypothetical protein
VTVVSENFTVRAGVTSKCPEGRSGFGDVLIEKLMVRDKLESVLAELSSLAVIWLPLDSTPTVPS